LNFEFIFGKDYVQLGKLGCGEAADIIQRKSY